MLRIEREVRFLKLYAVVSTLVLLVLVTAAFRQQPRRERFEEIDVERINIVEKDGKLRMVVSNQERQHPGIWNGKTIERKGPRPPGMIFFNHLGDEMGGLIFGEYGADGHFGSLTWDKVRNDQTMGFRHLERDGTYTTALEMWQQPNIPGDVMKDKYEAAMRIPDETERKAAIQALVDNNELYTNRLFLGKDVDNSLLLLMRDIKGRPRIRMQVAPDGTPKLQFLDEARKVICSLPEENKAGR